MVNGPMAVKGQPRASLPFGLFSVLSLRESSDPHWMNGVDWEAMTCDPASSYDIECEDPETERLRLWAQNAESTGGGKAEASAFNVYGFAKCGMPGGRDFVQGEEDATAHLLAREEAQAESQTWRRLSADAVDLSPDGPLAPRRALARLERWMGQEYGSLGALHADREVATLLADNGRASSSGARLLTTLGTPLVAGSGYPGSGPLRTEIQTVTVTDTSDEVTEPSGTFTLSLADQTTDPLAWNATAGDVAAALSALTGVMAAADGGPLGTDVVTVTFDSDEDIPLMTSDGTGLTLATVSTAATADGGPTPTTADTAWVYASPALFGYRGPVFASDREGGFDRARNDHFAVAQRQYVVGFDPCGVGAVRVDLNG